MSGLFFDNWDTPVFRPPSESGSFILRVTRGCAHNSCTYCNMYRGVRFEKLSDDEIMRQIAMAYSVDRDGVRRVFLADGDALVLPTERLLRILETLRKYFPNLTRVSSYAAPADAKWLSHLWHTNNCQLAVTMQKDVERLRQIAHSLPQPLVGSLLVQPIVVDIEPARTDDKLFNQTILDYVRAN